LWLIRVAVILKLDGKWNGKKRASDERVSAPA